MMPDGGAVDFLKRRKSKISVIVITAALEAQSNYALEAGATAVCSKQDIKMKLVPLLEQIIVQKYQA
jgi:CheY-like chemotaxis protein